MILICTPITGHPVMGVLLCAIHMSIKGCVELYRQGKWPDTPDGIKERNFRITIRRWVRQEDGHGPEVLKHKPQNKEWTPEQRLEYVSQVLSGKTVKSVALEAGISDGMLYKWVQKYKTMGYNGLATIHKGRPSREALKDHKIIQSMSRKGSCYDNCSGASPMLRITAGVAISSSSSRRSLH